MTLTLQELQRRACRLGYVLLEHGQDGLLLTNQGTVKHRKETRLKSQRQDRTVLDAAADLLDAMETAQNRANG